MQRGALGCDLVMIRMSDERQCCHKSLDVSFSYICQTPCVISAVRGSFGVREILPQSETRFIDDVRAESDSGQDPTLAEEPERGVLKQSVCESPLQGV